MKTTILSLFILSIISFAIPTMAVETETQDCAAISDLEGNDTTVRTEGSDQVEDTATDQ